MTVSEWTFDDQWVTWWSHASRPSIECDGHENGHWRMLQSNPHLVSPDGSFATFLATEDVEDDEDARAKMKHTVFAAGYVRCGLVQTDRGYAQGQDPKAVRKAAREMVERSGGTLQYLDVIIVPATLREYNDDDGGGRWSPLSGADAIDRFIRRGVLPRRAERHAASRTAQDDSMDETERDAERWRKLVALLQHSYDADDVETDELYLTARMLSARGESRRVAVTLSFSDERDQPLDLASAIDAAPWPEPARDDADEDGAQPGPG